MKTIGLCSALLLLGLLAGAAPIRIFSVGLEAGGAQAVRARPLPIR